MTSGSVPGRPARRRCGTGAASGPVQRDVSGPLASSLALLGATLAVYLAAAVACGSTARPAGSTTDDCTDRVVHHAARLSDC